MEPSQACNLPLRQPEVSPVTSTPPFERRGELEWPQLIRCGTLLLALAACDKPDVVDEPDSWRVAEDAGNLVAPCEYGSSAGDTLDRDILIDDSAFPCIVVEQRRSIVVAGEYESGIPEPLRGPIPVITSSGQMVVMSNNPTDELVTLWDSAGRFITSYGRRGDGPGELAGLGALLFFAAPSDSLYIIDDTNRWSVLDEKLNFHRSFRTTYRGRNARAIHVTDTGQILTSGSGFGEWGEHYFTIFDREGGYVRSFGEIQWTPALRAQPVERTTSYVGGTTFWAAPPNAVRSAQAFEQWSLQGDLIRTVRREVPWVTKKEPENPNEPVRTPHYAILNVDGEGLLWVVQLVPDRQGSQSAIIKKDDQENIANLYDMRLEVLDVNAGRALASLIFDDVSKLPFSGMIQGTRRFYRVITDELGVDALEFFEVDLVSKEAGRS